MDCTVQEINIHKQMLINLVNKIINTQIINEEISINNEIKKESECLNSLLNIKQNYLMNQFNQNNFNNLILQQNQVMFPPSPIIPVNINLFNQEQPQMFRKINSFNNFGNFSNKDNGAGDYYNCIFKKVNGKIFTLICKPNEKVEDVIKKYREKAQDYEEQLFGVNGFDLRKKLNFTLEELCQYRCINPDTMLFSVGYI